jgi:hypothetical protein
MTRSFLLWLLVSGCDLVIPLTEPVEAACGPYKHVERVLFEDALVDAHDFSVAYDGTTAMVVSRVKNGGSIVFMGPVPITQGTDGVWVQDNRLQNMRDYNLTGGHMLGMGTFFGWKDYSMQLGLPRLARYTFVNAKWSEAITPELDVDSSKNYRPGNEIVLPLEGQELRLFPIVKESYDGTGRRQIFVRQKYGNTNWGPTAQTDKISMASDINPSAVVMTANHKILIYAASVKERKQRIYASVRDPNTDAYAPGIELDLDAKDDLDDTEPWIREDCSELYFRRGDITYRATK